MRNSVESILFSNAIHWTLKINLVVAIEQIIQRELVLWRVLYYRTKTNYDDNTNVRVSKISKWLIVRSQFIQLGFICFLYALLIAQDKLSTALIINEINRLLINTFYRMWNCHLCAGRLHSANKQKRDETSTNWLSFLEECETVCYLAICYLLQSYSIVMWMLILLYLLSSINCALN